MIKTKSAEIRNAISDAEPHTVAVAYVGAHWRQYVSNVGRLAQVIVSPTGGTNPRAIEQLALEMPGGWESVLFLNKLHAKIYLGAKSAVVGSANWSMNGLGTDDPLAGLREACVVVSDPNDLTSIRQYVEHLACEARKQYPTTEKKKKRLDALLQEQKLRSIAILKAGKDFLEFDWSADEPTYVEWLFPGPERLDAAVVQSEFGDWIEDDEGANWMGLHPEDSLTLPCWVLCWYANRSKMCGDRSRLEWIRLDEKLPKAVLDSPYSTAGLALELDRVPPFTINDRVLVKAFRQTINQARFDCLRPSPTNEDTWKASDTAPILPAFFEELKKQYRRAASAAKKA